MAVMPFSGNGSLRAWVSLDLQLCGPLAAVARQSTFSRNRKYHQRECLLQKRQNCIVAGSGLNCIAPGAGGGLNCIVRAQTAWRGTKLLGAGLNCMVHGGGGYRACEWLLPKWRDSLIADRPSGAAVTDATSEAAGREIKLRREHI